jgi:hypothetical protein
LSTAPIIYTREENTVLTWTTLDVQFGFKAWTERWIEIAILHRLGAFVCPDKNTISNPGLVCGMKRAGG